MVTLSTSWPCLCVCSDDGMRVDPTTPNVKYTNGFDVLYDMMRQATKTKTATLILFYPKNANAYRFNQKTLTTSVELCVVLCSISIRCHGGVYGHTQQKRLEYIVLWWQLYIIARLNYRNKATRPNTTQLSLCSTKYICIVNPRRSK